MMEEKKETFTYTYSASRQEEVRRIREKYALATKEEDKLERLRRLDRAATKTAMWAGAQPQLGGWQPFCKLLY